VPTFADQAEPALDVAELVARADDKARAILAQVVGDAPEAISQIPNQAGESALGDLAADAQRMATGASIALVNQGALRGDLDQGPVTWGELLAIHPFGSVIVTLELTGAALHGVLEEQFSHDPPHLLQVSGLTYTWDAALPVGKRVLGIRVGREPLVDETIYTVAVSDYLARGGAGFSRLTAGKNRRVGPRDVDALRAFIVASGGRAEARIAHRIVRRD
jgi:5'-nucleotidase